MSCVDARVYKLGLTDTNDAMTLFPNCVLAWPLSLSLELASEERIEMERRIFIHCKSKYKQQHAAIESKRSKMRKIAVSYDFQPITLINLNPYPIISRLQIFLNTRVYKFICLQTQL